MKFITQPLFLFTPQRFTLGLLMATAALCVVFGASSGCRKHATSDSRTQTNSRFQAFNHQNALATFEFPVHWSALLEQDVWVLAGARDTDEFFTTLSYQQFANAEDDLPAALLRAYQHLPHAEDLHFDEQRHGDLAGQEALFYTLSFELYEISRRRSGVLVQCGDNAVDLTFTAPTELFAQHEHIWTHARTTLALRQCPARPQSLKNGLDDREETHKHE